MKGCEESGCRGPLRCRHTQPHLPGTTKIHDIETEFASSSLSRNTLALEAQVMLAMVNS